MKPPHGSRTRLSWICGRTPIPTFPSTNKPRPSTPICENNLRRVAHPVVLVWFHFGSCLRLLKCGGGTFWYFEGCAVSGINKLWGRTTDGSTVVPDRICRNA